MGTGESGVRYLVSRTSGYGQQPCEEAHEIEVIDVDTRDVDDPKKIPAFNGTDGDWYTRGTNHRVVNGKIMRDLGTRTEWFAEIADIHAFVDKYGDCIIGREPSGLFTIEIYDDYRE